MPLIDIQANSAGAVTHIRVHSIVRTAEVHKAGLLPEQKAAL